MTSYIGIDPSFTCTGVAVLNAAGAVETTYQIKVRAVGNYISRGLEIVKDLRDIYDSHSPTGVAIEGYGGTTFNLVPMVTLGTLIRKHLLGCKVPYIDVPPSSLKMFATGKGNSAKQVVMKEVFKRWGYDSNSDDVCDAFVLAKMAYHGLSPMSEGLTKFQILALDKLKFGGDA